MKIPAVSIILLAAGTSSRMGSPKQLLPWKGSFLLQDRLAIALASNAREVIVVLGAYSERIRKALGPVPGAIIQENRAWRTGLGSSIGSGMDYIQGQAERPDGVLLMLGDQPLIQTSYLNDMIRLFGEAREEIVASRYGEHAGVPALFGRKYFDLLGKLKDDSGAKSLLLDNKPDTRLLDAGPGIADIDSPEDYERLSRSSIHSKAPGKGLGSKE